MVLCVWARRVPGQPGSLRWVCRVWGQRAAPGQVDRCWESPWGQAPLLPTPPEPSSEPLGGGAWGGA